MALTKEQLTKIRELLNGYNIALDSHLYKHRNTHDDEVACEDMIEAIDKEIGEL